MSTRTADEIMHALLGRGQATQGDWLAGWTHLGRCQPEAMDRFVAPLAAGLWWRRDQPGGTQALQRVFEITYQVRADLGSCFLEALAARRADALDLWLTAGQTRDARQDTALVDTLIRVVGAASQQDVLIRVLLTHAVGDALHHREDRLLEHLLCIEPSRGHAQHTTDWGRGGGNLLYPWLEAIHSTRQRKTAPEDARRVLDRLVAHGIREDQACWLQYWTAPKGAAATAVTYRFTRFFDLVCHQARAGDRAGALALDVLLDAGMDWGRQDEGQRRAAAQIRQHPAWRRAQLQGRGAALARNPRDAIQAVRQL